MFDLEEYQWKNRVLIIFTDSEDTPPFNAQMRILGEEKDGLLDRDLIIVEVLEKGNSRCGEIQIAAQAAEKLRKQFQVTPGLFQVLLLGKDGGIKLRRGEPVLAKDLFGIIDSMPMRQQEMRRNN
ncbi:DUF4174 domain-containing protein [Thermodesulfobacteriota bacterium]